MAGLTRTEKVDILALLLSAAIVAYDSDPRRAELAIARGLQRTAGALRGAGTWALTQAIRTENWAKDWAQEGTA